MITGIYNLPDELCSAIGAAVTDFVLAGSDEKQYNREVKNAFGILSEDSKIMISEVALDLFGNSAKVTSVWDRFVVDRTVSIRAMFFDSLFRIYIIAEADAYSPNMVNITVVSF